jgi:hypothetical protein
MHSPERKGNDPGRLRPKTELCEALLNWVRGLALIPRPLLPLQRAEGVTSLD